MELRAVKLSRVTASGAVLLDAVSLHVVTGEVLAVLGPSGAGKSTLLRLLNRLDEPTSGSVYLDDVDTSTVAPTTLRRTVGMVMQQAHLFPGTVADNIAWGPAVRGEHLSEADISRLLARVGLTGYETRDTQGLSGGEGQRVSVARTLANTPSILLLDEPTSALDDAAKREVEVTLQAVLADHSLAAVLVTHDGDQAERLATRAVGLRHGAVVAAGTVQEVRDALVVA